MRVASRLIASVAALAIAACSSGTNDQADRASRAVSTVTSPQSSLATALPTSATAPMARLGDLRVRLTEVARFASPTVIAARPGDTRLWVAQRNGQVFADSALALDITSIVKAGGEQGLLGIAFNQSGDRLYVHYSDRAGDTTLDEFTVDSVGRIETGSRRHILGQEQPRPNHNGGSVAFGPDGYLYLALGDGGAAGDPSRYAGNLDSLLGKLLRIAPNASGYAVPDDNPFVGRAGARPEIFAYGLRNPWRVSFDPLTGDLWIGDVGQGALEEVDRLAAGERGIDFGWSAYEGTSRYNTDVDSPTHRAPVHQYSHGTGPLEGCSITGGAIYRGSLIPALQGAYVFADYCVAGIRALDPAAPAQAVVLTSDGAAVSTFGVGPDGELYVASLDGPVYRIDPTSASR